MNARHRPNSEKLSKLLLMLGSDAPGEVFAAAQAIRRTLAADGLDLHDLAARLVKAEPTPDPTPEMPAGDLAATLELIWACRLHRNNTVLTAWERIFLGSIDGQVREWGRLTDKQTAVLLRIRAKLDGGAR